MEKRIFHLRTEILSNLRRDWTIAEMAKTVEMPVSHFQKFFKVQTGTSPVAYLHELRLEKAKELLETTFHQIKQIAYETGMSDHSHFTRGFKKRYGATPTEYRRLHSEEMQNKQPDGQE